ncbi:MAG: alpha/beta hydrolase [Vicinamibacteria bacterium]
MLLYGGALFVALPIVLGHALTRTYHSGVSAEPPPGYESIGIESQGLRLRAWLARGVAGKPAVVIVHGLGDTLESYQRHALPFLERGHTVLLLDLRGHGGSEGSRTTLGGRESEDVRAAMSSLRQAGLADSGFVLMGHSMGAVAVLLAAGSESDVRAVIAEAPFDSYRNTVAHHARLLYGLPSWVPVIPLSIFAAEWLGDFDADAIDTVHAAERVEAPILAIVDGLDERMPESVVRRILDAHRGPHRLWIAAGVDHVGAIEHQDWGKEILQFLEF